jgi:NADH:ubiquinone reductase (H+-translocating)
MRHKLLYAFERAERAESEEEARAWLTFVIVGAGATGLELAGALAEIAHETLRHDFRRIRPQEARIFLLEGGPRVLGGYPEDLSAKAAHLVEHLGVQVLTEAMVTNIDSEGVTYQHNGKDNNVPARTVLWAGGVTATPFARRVAERLGVETDKAGRFIVNADLTLPGHPEIFALGDLAHSIDKDGEQLPGVAQVAIQGGRHAGKAIQARLQGKTLPPFKYFDKGDMAVIGRAAAVAKIFGFHVSGFLAWFTWVFIHLIYIVQFQSRVRVFVQWGFLYLTFSRSARLITGESPTTEKPSTPKFTAA